MDIMTKNDVLHFYWSRTISALWGHLFIFIMGVPPSIFVAVGFLLMASRKDYFLFRRRQRYRFLMTDIAVLLGFDIRLPTSSQLQCGIDLCMMDGYILAVLC